MEYFVETTLLCREKAFGNMTGGRKMAHSLLGIGNWMIGFAPSISLYLLFFDLFF